MAAKRWSDKDIDRALRYDALDEAEHVTGTSYKEDLKTGFLGMGLMARNVEAKEKMLRDNGDVSFGMKLDEYLGVIEKNGFKQVGRWDFRSFFKGQESEAKEESLLVYFRHPGQLLVFDTYFGRGCVNSGHIYYNIRHVSHENWDCAITSSGHWEISDPSFSEWNEAKQAGATCWVGDHDCREAVLHNMNRFAQFGEFLEPWAYPPSVWMLHHMDTKTETGEQRNFRDYDSYAISYARASELPKEIREAVSLDKWPKKQNHR